jgi:hypothetical protein
MSFLTKSLTRLNAFLVRASGGRLGGLLVGRHKHLVRPIA